MRIPREFYQLPLDNRGPMPHIRAMPRSPWSLPLLLAIVFPAWIKYVYKDNVPRFVQWATRVFDVDLAFDDPDAIVLEGVRRLEAFFQQMELSVRLHEIGIDDTRLEEMAEKAAPVGNFKVLEKKDIVEIYKLAL